MNTQNRTKLKALLVHHKPGTVALPQWLEGLGISRDLQKAYRRSGWLESLGSGAMIKPGDHVSWQGALYAIQKQADVPIHVGALTALSTQGYGHYIRLTQETIFLFAPLNVSLPRWFTEHRWEHPVQLVKTSLFPDKAGLTEQNEKDFSITIASPERAILECLYLAPKKFDLMECYHLVEGLSGLRPKLVQELLEKCSSVKVKRLFLFMASKAKHKWLDYVDQRKVDLGHGDRSIVPGGVYNIQFKISIPKTLAEK
ncbi:MAG TPA: type IV toxin-antitoxin system AbiEi family antitoxin [Ohtaekwangia sp.]